MTSVFNCLNDIFSTFHRQLLCFCSVSAYIGICTICANWACTLGCKLNYKVLGSPKPSYPEDLNLHFAGFLTQHANHHTTSHKLPTLSSSIPFEAGPLGKSKEIMWDQEEHRKPEGKWLSVIADALERNKPYILGAKLPWSFAPREAEHPYPPPSHPF